MGQASAGTSAPALRSPSEGSYQWEGWNLLTDLPSAPIRSAAEDNYPPFSLLTPDNHVDGFSVELLRGVLAIMGREIQFAIGPRSVLEQELAEGRLQVLPVFSRTNKRETLFDFSVPYLKIPGAIVVRNGDESIHGIDDLKDKKILVMADDIAEDYILSLIHI